MFWINLLNVLQEQAGTGPVANVFLVWITAITVLGPPLMAIAFWVIKRMLGEIRTATNGNLSNALAKVEELKARLKEAGIDHE